MSIARIFGFPGPLTQIAGTNVGRRPRRKLTDAERAEQHRTRDEAWRAHAALALMLKPVAELHETIKAAQGLRNVPPVLPYLTRDVVARWSKARRADDDTAA